MKEIKEYSRQGDFVTILIKDHNYNQIYKKVIQLSNKTEYFETMMEIAEKYGFKAEIELGKDVNTKQKIQEEKDKEIDWLS